MHRPRPLLTNTRFHVFWVSAAAIGFGDQIVMNAAMAMVGGWKGDEDTTAALGVNQFFFFLPYLLLSAPGGWLADRAPRRWILAACEWARAALLAVAFALLPAGVVLQAAPPEEHWKVFALLAAIGACATFFYPARMACIPEVVGQDKVQAGNAVISSVTIIAAMIGKLIIGEWMEPTETSSIRQFLFMAVALYVVAGIAFACVRVDRRRAPETAAARHPTGTRYILGHRGTLAINALYLFIWGVAMVVTSAVPALIKDRFGVVGEKELMSGTLHLTATIGVGLLVGAGLMMVLPSRRQMQWLMTLALVGVGLAAATMSLARHGALMYPAAFVVGFCGNICLVGCLSALQAATPDFMRGRVMGVNSMISTVGQLAVLFCVGFPEINKAIGHMHLPSLPGRIPPADHWILPTLRVTCGLLVVVGAALTLRQLVRGPMHSPLANLIWRISDLFVRQWHRLEVVGKHHVPVAGGAMLVLNHTTALDPLLAQGASPRRLVRWLMIDKFHFWFLAPVWRAARPIVFKEGDRAQAQLRAMLDAIEAGELVGVFPEGGLQRKQRTLRRFGGGAAFLARKAGCPVVPAWIHGTTRANTLWAHLLWPSKCTVVVGEPLRCGADEDEAAFGLRLRAAMQELASKVPPERRRYAESAA